jgi:phosphoglucomutase
MSTVTETIIEATLVNICCAPIKQISWDHGIVTVLGIEVEYQIDGAGELRLVGGIWDAELDGQVISIYNDGLDSEVVVVPAALWDKLANRIYSRVMG